MTTTSHNTAFCVKYRETKEIVDPRPVMLKNGRPSLQGTCPTCGTRLVRIVSKSSA